MNNIRNRN